MANVKISELAANAAVTPATDVLPMVHSGATEKVTPQALVNAGLLAPGPIGGGTPGTITGTTVTGAAIVPNGSTVPVNGMYLSAANVLDFSTNTVRRLEIDANGNIGINAAAPSNASLQIVSNITGSTTSSGLQENGVVQSDVTNTAYGIRTSLGTQATSFTCGLLSHFTANQGTFGAGSTVTSQVGFNVLNTLTGAGTSNYGFRGQLAAAAGRYNLYMDGTAMNYIAGDMQFGKTIIAAGTTGAQTISKTIGSVNFAAAATSLVVTNTLVSLSSVVICQVAKNDTTMKSVQVVQASGSFTIYANAAATAETRVNFVVFN